MTWSPTLRGAEGGEEDVRNEKGVKRGYIGNSEAPVYHSPTAKYCDNHQQ